MQAARDEDLGRDYQPERWERVDGADEVRTEASGAVRRGRTGSGRAPRSEAGSAGRPSPHRDELAKAAGPRQADKLAKALKEAAKAYDKERFVEARKALVPLADRAPDFAPGRELLGLTYYRMGHWKLAAKEVEAFRGLTGSTEQHPVLADCYRALRRWTQVDDLWEELREASPSAELVTEGRIVAAGALADQGKLPQAITLLGAKGWKLPPHPKEHHLRRAYALADLYERAGEVPRARDLFVRVLRADPDFGDIADRVRTLG